jgi:hypothetical protein
VESWEFGQAVRRWRDRAAPGAVGVPVGGRRRAAGLRREELAGLASISVDYLTRLEQGRATSPSSQVVEALARALRLSDAERELLFRLAGQITSWRGIERNGIWRNLVGPGSRAVHTPQQQARFEALLVGDLRMTAARYPADRELKRLIADLTAHSPRFVELWESGEVGSSQDRSRHKIIDHPDVGLITLDCDALIVAGDDLRITVYTAEPGTEDAERLALAIVLGTQTLID